MVDQAQPRITRPLATRKDLSPESDRPKPETGRIHPHGAAVRNLDPPTKLQQSSARMGVCPFARLSFGHLGRPPISTNVIGHGESSHQRSAPCSLIPAHCYLKKRERSMASAIALYPASVGCAWSPLSYMARIRVGEFGSRRTRSKSITPSYSPPVRIH